MDGLGIISTPFKREVDSVIANGEITPCYSFDIELLAGNERIKPFSIIGITTIDDFVDSYYPVIAVEMQASLYVKELLLNNNGDITAVLKRYEIGRNSTVTPDMLRNPVIKRYKAKLYTEESDYLSQENVAVNNEDFSRNKAMVSIKVQLVEAGFEELKNRYVGGTYYKTTGWKLIRHLVDYHANLDNNDVASLIQGVDIAPGVSELIRDQVVIDQGTSLVEAMNVVNRETGGIYPTGFSYYIHNNVWHVFSPYALTRFKETNKSAIIVNLPKNKLPGLERTFLNSSTSITILSTREVNVKDKREARKFNFGLGLRFGDVSKLVGKASKVVNNKLLINASENVNDIIIADSKDGTNQLRFADNKLTAAKNLELSKLAPSRGVLMRISWENSNDTHIYPGMPVKVLYLKNNQVKSMTGSFIGKETIYYPIEQQYPAKKFGTLTYLEVFVSDEVDTAISPTSTLSKQYIDPTADNIRF